MPDHDSHHHHVGHTHAHHGGVAHAPAAGATEAYRRAYDSAKPDPAHTVVRVDLEARAVDWSVASSTEPASRSSRLPRARSSAGASSMLRARATCGYRSGALRFGFWGPIAV